MSEPKADDTRRPRGRPRVEEPMTTISTRIPVRDHDKLIRLANQREISVADLVRRRLLDRRR